MREYFQVITVDVRGSGESDFRADVTDYEVGKNCADLTTVADACQAGQFAIWGYSLEATS